MGPGFRAVLMAFGLATQATAQATPAAPVGEVTGVVYDSIGGRVLAGANVQIVPQGAPGSWIRTSVSDAGGAFQFADVPPGRYLLGFTHQVLDSFALEVPTRLVEVSERQRTTAHLGVPAPLTILSSICGPRAANDSSGVMIGSIRDARSRLPNDSGSVETQWTELVFADRSLSIEPRRVSAGVGQHGWFVLCNLPGNTELAALAASRRDSTGLVEVVVPARGVLRRDFFVGGTASVRGMVVDPDRKPLVNVSVALAGRERSTYTDSAGTFVLREVVAGSQTLQVRNVGYGPELRHLELVHGADTTLTVTLTPVKRILDTIRVVRQRVFDRDRSGFARRSRAGTGRFLNEDQIARHNAFDIYQLLQRLPGLRVQYDGFRRYLGMRSDRAGYCLPTIWVDGMSLGSMENADLDLMVRPDHLVGVEVYRSFVPPEFSAFTSCGAVVLWTTTRPRR
jgi:hypothetical protein